MKYRVFPVAKYLSPGLLLLVGVGILRTAAFGDSSKQPASGAEVRIPAGYYKPFYVTKGTDSVRIPSFMLDKYEVTNLDYLHFVTKNPRWARSKVSPILADGGYLQHWRGDFDIGDADLNSAPVTNVSWFAAKAYAKWVGKRLPTIQEWEYASLADIVKPKHLKGEDKNKMILAWYSQPNVARYPPVGSANQNAYGVTDMFGGVWEWVEDFNSIVIPNDPRGGLDTRSFCGSGAFGTLDPTDYATFMRFAMRNSLKARYCVRSLGFRCASDISKTKH